MKLEEMWLYLLSENINVVEQGSSEVLYAAVDYARWNDIPKKLKNREVKCIRPVDESTVEVVVWKN